MLHSFGIDKKLKIDIAHAWKEIRRDKGNLEGQKYSMKVSPLKIKLICLSNFSYNNY